MNVEDLPDPEVIALSVLHQGEQYKPPIDTTRLAGLWPGLRISYDDLERPGYLVDLGVLGAEIIVRAADSPVRQRFTVAHELGHWVLSREVATEGHRVFDCSSKRMLRTPLQRRREPQGPIVDL